MTTFTSGATSATIALPPVRPFTATIPLDQQTGLTSTGSPYVYDRTISVVRSITLTFSRVTAAELAGLTTLLQAISGNRHLFFWTDPDSVQHTVRYVSHTWLQTTPTYYRFVLSLDEQFWGGGSH